MLIINHLNILDKAGSLRTQCLVQFVLEKKERRVKYYKKASLYNNLRSLPSLPPNALQYSSLFCQLRPHWLPCCSLTRPTWGPWHWLFYLECSILDISVDDSFPSFKSLLRHSLLKQATLTTLVEFAALHFVHLLCSIFPIALTIF